MSGRPAAGRRPAAAWPAPARGAGRGRPAGRAARSRRSGRGRGPGMMGMGMGLPPAKSKDFRGSFRRLLGHLRPERPLIVARHRARRRQRLVRRHRPEDPGQRDQHDLRGRHQPTSCPPGVTQEQVIAGLRAQGQNQLADMLSAMHLTPGLGIDFARARAASSLLLVGRLRAQLALRLDAGLHHGRRHPADGLPPARATSTTSSAGCRSATSTATRAATC